MQFIIFVRALLGFEFPMWRQAMQGAVVLAMAWLNCNKFAWQQNEPNKMRANACPTEKMEAASDPPAEPQTPHALPTFTMHASSAWSVDQVLEAFTEIHYGKFEFIPGKGKKDEKKKTTVTAINAHMIGGVLHFFEKAASKISTTCPAFCDAIPRKTISGETLRKMWSGKVEYRIAQRLSWGKGPNAFHETGDGDFPDLDGDVEKIMGKGSATFTKDKRFDLCFKNAQIDDLIDVHLRNLSEAEEAHRKRASTDSSGSLVANLHDGALVLFRKDAGATCFGKSMNPPAKEGDVSGASMLRSRVNTQGFKKGNFDESCKRSKVDDGVEKSLSFGNSVVNLGDRMLAAMSPSVEFLQNRARATATEYTNVIKDGLTSTVLAGHFFPYTFSLIAAID